MPRSPSLQAGEMAGRSIVAVYPCRIGSFPGSDYRHRRKRPPGGAPGSGTPALQRSGQSVVPPSLPPRLRPSTRGGANPCSLRGLRGPAVPAPAVAVPPTPLPPPPVGRVKQAPRPRHGHGHALPPTGPTSQPSPPPRPACPSPRRAAPPLRSVLSLAPQRPRTLSQQTSANPGGTPSLTDRPRTPSGHTPPGSGSSLASAAPPQAEATPTDARPTAQQNSNATRPRCRLCPRSARAMTLSRPLPRGRHPGRPAGAGGRWARRLKRCPRRPRRFRAPSCGNA